MGEHEKNATEPNPACQSTSAINAHNGSNWVSGPRCSDETDSLYFKIEQKGKKKYMNI